MLKGRGHQQPGSASWAPVVACSPATAGTRIKQILAEADAAFASLYHFFPGGKEQLAAEAICTSGAMYQDLVEGVLDAVPGLLAGIGDCFAGAAGRCAPPVTLTPARSPPSRSRPPAPTRRSGRPADVFASEEDYRYLAVPVVMRSVRYSRQFPGPEAKVPRGVSSPLADPPEGPSAQQTQTRVGPRLGSRADSPLPRRRHGRIRQAARHRLGAAERTWGYQG
jgi:hypothetical protein